ncbi:MAG: glycerol kinase GlpK [Pseudomonadota bacterium]
MTKPLVLAIDQGTTSSRAIVLDPQLNIVASAQQEFPQSYPADGWVEHDPEAIWSSVLAVTRQALNEAERTGEVVAIGITNQRETVVVWDRETGDPIANAIVWQDRRTADRCEALAQGGHAENVRHRTGLLLDPYFSASKIAWLLDHVPGAREQANAGRLAFGTIDSFLLWRLTAGRVHATDATNASRTSLYNVREHRWDSALLALFDVPDAVLPEVRDSAGDFGEACETLLGRPIPIRGIAGDQQAAAIGQCCFEPGSIKATYGTGCFVLTPTGPRLVESSHRLLGTVAWQLDGEVAYALEGSIFTAGAAVQWLRDGLKVIDSASATETIAAGLPDTGGVYLVPAFTGLGAPWWNPDARATITGMTFATTPAEIVRATLEAVCYQTHDLLNAIEADGVVPRNLRVDGGMVANDWLVQFLADVLDLPIERPRIMETTALGAAYLAGRAAGVFGSFDAFSATWTRQASFTPDMAPDRRTSLLAGWRRAIERSLAG